MRTAWPIRKLEDVVDIFNGSTPLRGRDEYWNSPDVPWFTIDDIREQGRIISSTRQFVSNEALESTSLKLLPSKTTLLCCTASVGEYAFSEIPLTTNQQFNGLVVNRENSTKILPKYIFYFAGTLKDKLLKSGGKTSFDYVSVGNLKKIELAIPDLQTQKKIVERLDEIRKAQELNDQLISKTQELLESTFAHSIASYSGRRKALGEFVNFSQLGVVKSKNDYSNDSDSVKYIKMDAILESGEIDTKKAVGVNASKDEIKDYKLRRGDFLFNTRNAPNLVGKSAVFKSNGEFIFNNNILRLRFENILPEFVNAYLHTETGKDQLNLIKNGTTSVAAIYQKNLFKLKIPAPGLKIQQRIVEKLDAIKNYKNLLLKQRGLYQELFNSTLHKSLSGELDQ